MGLSNTKSVNAKFIKINAGKKDAKPFFGLKGTKEQNYEIQEQFNQLEGFLDGVEVGTFEWEGKKKDTIKLTFRDNQDELMIVDGSFNTGIMRSLLNTLAGSDLLTNFKMQLYLNKEGYPSIYITDTNGSRMQWKYKPEEMPKAETTTLKNGDKVIDDFEVVNFFKKLIEEDIKPRLASHNTPTINQQKEAKEIKVNNPNDTDLPF